MDGMQIALPVLGIVAAAAVTFYAISFAELQEKSFIELSAKYDNDDDDDMDYTPRRSPKDRRALRKAGKKSKSNK